MINPHELQSYSQRTLAEQHQKAEMQQLAQEAQGRTERDAQGAGLLRRLVSWMSSMRLLGRANTDARSY